MSDTSIWLGVVCLLLVVVVGMLGLVLGRLDALLARPVEHVGNTVSRHEGGPGDQVNGWEVFDARHQDAFARAARAERIRKNREG